MPVSKGHQKQKERVKMARTMPTFCLTLPDGMSLTSIVLEGIGPNGQLLTGPAAHPWRHKSQRGTIVPNMPSVTNPKSILKDKRQHSSGDDSSADVRDIQLKIPGSVKFISNELQHSDAKANRSFLSISPDKSTALSVKSSGSSSVLNSSYASFQKGGFWSKIKRYNASQDRGWRSREFAVIAAFQRGRHSASSGRLVMPAASSKLQVIFIFFLKSVHD
ncbi:hypothetical protein PoB_006472400 [Plakobranchus ocellatus]|uniref:Uncharacterized protein n=1 Tax=Plakobranchus ocellatus TaxID=259542 RepID=A0AAV4D221_9GAST|nr:hypothetical protein PoB_006472400 [Plakobranchus ocellatus]